MRGSVRIAKVFGISIEIHFTFVILPAIFGLFYGLQFGLIYGIRIVVLILFVFLCVTLHEICHCLQAMRFGAKVNKIILFPIGGVSMMRSLPEKPHHELLISIVGPLFNFFLAAITYFPLRQLLGPEVLHHPSFSTWSHTVAYMFWINPILGTFNLLPAFPLDGGRIFRAFLAERMDYLKATRIAVAMGHTMALMLGFLGLLFAHYLLVIIAVFIYMAASQEEVEVDVRMTLKNFRIEDILPADCKSISGEFTLAQVLEIVFHSHQEDFPVVEKGKLVGLLTRRDLISAIHRQGTDKKVKEVMRTKFPIVRLKDPLDKVHRLMLEHGVKAIPVLKGNIPCGVVTVEDLTKVYSVLSVRKG